MDFTWFEGIPAPLWGVVGVLAGSFFSLIALAISNRHTRRLQRNLLEHNAAEKARERELQLKRDIFVPMLGANAAMTSALGDLMNPDTPQAAMSHAFRELLQNLASASLVVKPVTVALVAHYLLTVNRVHAEVVTLRAPLLQAHAELVANRNGLDAEIADAAAANSLVKEEYLSDSRSAEKMSLLQQRFDRHSGMVGYFQGQVRESNRKVVAARLELMELMKFRMVDLSESSADLLEGLRDELGVATDNLGLRAALRDALAANVALMDELMPKRP